MSSRPGRRPGRREALEVLIGFLGFFAAAVFVTAAVEIVRGTPSVTASLVLLVLLIVLAAAWRVRRRL